MKRLKGKDRKIRWEGKSRKIKIWERKKGKKTGGIKRRKIKKIKGR